MRDWFSGRSIPWRSSSTSASISCSSSRRQLQATSNFFALSLGLRLLKRVLEFLEPLVQVLLALRQLLEPAQHLELLALLGVLLRRGLPLGS